jgi:hypothetical protein
VHPLCLLAALVLGLTAAGCGTGDSGRVAGPQVRKLDWHENCGTRAQRIPITTGRLIVHSGRWRVDLAFRNETSVSLSVIRPHYLGSTYFGLEPFDSATRREVLGRAEAGAAKPRTLADRFSPEKPGLLAPGQRWSGWFSGPGALPAGVPLRVVLGRFVILGSVPHGLLSGFLCVSRRVVRLD